MAGIVQLGERAVGVPEDPIADAVVPGLTVLEHMALGEPARAGAAAARRVRGVHVGVPMASLDGAEPGVVVAFDQASATDYLDAQRMRVLLRDRLATVFAA